MRTTGEFFEHQVPFVAGLPANTAGESIAYVCENFSCQLPTNDPVKLAELLTRSSGRTTAVK